MCKHAHSSSLAGYVRIILLLKFIIILNKRNTLVVSYYRYIVNFIIASVWNKMAVMRHFETFFGW